MTAQELKNSILQLAVQGKLVPQDKNDEPASELLKRIQAEKERLIKEGKIKKEKALPPIAEEELPFDIPQSWEWVRLNELASITSGGTPSRTNSTYWNGNIPWVKISDISSKYVENTEEYITLDGLNNSSAKIFPKGTLLYTIFATIGTVGILNIEAATNQAIAGINFDGEFNLDYMYYVAVGLKELLVAKGKGMAQMNINQSILKSTPIPIPPLAEQQRIVDKIEELLPLIEEYGKAEARLKELNADFPDMLRKSILQQAVQGKLTERNPEDEPASELLKRIQTEKAQLIKDGKLKKEKPLPPITEDEIPFDIPENWQFVRLGDIVRYQGGYAYKSDTYVGCSNNQVIRLGNVKNNKLLLDTASVFIPDYIACETEEYRIMPNTILFTMTGTKGKRDYFYTCCTTENNMGSNNLYLNQRVGCLKADSDICLEWLVVFLQSETVLSQIFATATGNVNQANIGSNSTLNLVLPLPPLEEQKRIVARVEELLALCDQLK